MWLDIVVNTEIMTSPNQAFYRGTLRSISDDPTPFEVQMRLYEKDVNDALVMDADREKVEEDVDT